jgi:multiple sugar transport system permease protein
VLVLFAAGNLSPFQALMIPVRELMLTFGIYDSQLALILFHTAFQTGFGTLLMNGFMRQLPSSVLEAGRIDGASEFTIFWRIVLPIVLPAVGALSVLIFTFVWNDFFWSLALVQSDSVRPVTAGLQSLRGMWVMSWQLMSAGAILAAVPPVCLFFLMQRYFIAGLSIRVTHQ